MDKAGLATRPIELVSPETDPGTVAAARSEGTEPAARATSTSGAATFWSDDVAEATAGGALPDRRRPVRHRASPLDYLPKLSLMPFVVAVNFAVFMWLIWTVIG